MKNKAGRIEFVSVRIVCLIISCTILCCYRVLNRSELETPELKNTLAMSIALSPDDSLLALSHSDYSGWNLPLYELSLSDSELYLLSPPGPGRYYNPCYSHDGTKLLFLARDLDSSGLTRIMICNRTTREAILISNNSFIVSRAIFSKNDSCIYFIAAEHFGTHSPLVKPVPYGFDIYSIDLTGSNLSRITAISASNMSGLALCGNGDSVVTIVSAQSVPENALSIDCEGLYCLSIRYPIAGGLLNFPWDIEPQGLVSGWNIGAFPDVSGWNIGVFPDGSGIILACRQIIEFDLSEQNWSTVYGDSISPRIFSPCIFNFSNKIVFVIDSKRSTVWENETIERSIAVFDRDTKEIRYLSLDFGKAKPKWFNLVEKFKGF